MGSTAQVVIPPTFTGPPTSGHGGVGGGFFASAVNPTSATVRFLAPLPLGKPLMVTVHDDEATVADGETMVATVRSIHDDLEVGQFGRLSSSDVEAAEARFLDDRDGEHFAPTCFACGNGRNDSHGLNLRPGTVSETGLMASAWRPNLGSEVPIWMIWAALDCPTGFPALVKLEPGEAVVTGELSVQIFDAVPGNGDYQLIGRRTGRDGRKFMTEAALVDEAGRSLAVATATWIVVPEARLRPPEELAAAV